MLDSFHRKYRNRKHFLPPTLPTSEVKWSEVKVIQLCPTLCDPMDYTAHGILQARILEWAALAFSRGSSQPRDRTQVSHIAGGFFTSWVTNLPLILGNLPFPLPTTILEECSIFLFYSLYSTSSPAPGLWFHYQMPALCSFLKIQITHVQASLPENSV